MPYKVSYFPLITMLSDFHCLEEIQEEKPKSAPANGSREWKIIAKCRSSVARINGNLKEFP
jgi:hypothetical protein